LKVSVLEFSHPGNGKKVFSAWSVGGQYRFKTVLRRKYLFLGWDVIAYMISFNIHSDPYLLGPRFDGSGPPREKARPTPRVAVAKL
jgi:hypothetical protein